MNIFSAIAGFFVGNKLGNAKPMGLLVAVGLFELIAIGCSLAGSAVGPICAVISGILMFVLGIRFGGNVVLCLICAFLQFFFMCGVAVGGSMSGGYVIACLICCIYPIAKACV